MNEEYYQRWMWEDKLPVYRVTETIDLKINLTSEPVFPWVAIQKQENNG